MLISFRNEKEEKFFQDFNLLSKKFGEQMAKKIIQRISELQAVDNFQQLPPSCRLHEHSGNRKGLFSLDLKHPFRLIVRPINKYVSYIEIEEVEIYEVTDPH